MRLLSIFPINVCIGHEYHPKAIRKKKRELIHARRQRIKAEEEEFGRRQDQKAHEKGFKKMKLKGRFTQHGHGHGKSVKEPELVHEASFAAWQRQTIEQIGKEYWNKIYDQETMEVYILPAESNPFVEVENPFLNLSSIHPPFIREQNKIIQIYSKIKSGMAGSCEKEEGGTPGNIPGRQRRRACAIECTRDGEGLACRRERGRRGYRQLHPFNVEAIISLLQQFYIDTPSPINLKQPSPRCQGEGVFSLFPFPILFP